MVPEVRSFRALGVLLEWPTVELQQAVPEIRAALAEEDVLPAEHRLALTPLFERLQNEDIYAAQERYYDLFDRGRAHALHLFEHIHGESRDRGQAMVDLLALYEQAGVSPRSDELPDYLPLFLEFLSLRPLAEARALLAEPAGVLAALAERLHRADPPYAAVFDALLALTGPLTARAVEETPADADDLAALDAAWEEPAVSFGPEAAGGAEAGRLARRLRASARDRAKQEG
jgi:nitrate reductase delta subunit